MEFYFLEIAQSELEESIEHYNSESQGLGDQFLIEVLDALESIRQYPTAWSAFSQNTRRRQLHRFPYGIVYQVSETEIIIVAVMHLHREPLYWRNRL